MKMVIQPVIFIIVLFFATPNLSTFEFGAQLSNQSIDQSTIFSNPKETRISDFLWMKGSYSLDAKPIEIEFLNNNEIKGKGFSLKQKGDKIFLHFENKTYAFQRVFETVFFFRKKNTGEKIGGEGVIYHFENKHGEKVEIVRFDYMQYFSIKKNKSTGKRLPEKFYYKK
ncbi:MAG: hypothetical protein AB8F94_00940 [Saprospiraceae bacterium]